MVRRMPSTHCVDYLENITPKTKGLSWSSIGVDPIIVERNGVQLVGAPASIAGVIASSTDIGSRKEKLVPI